MAHDENATGIERVDVLSMTNFADLNGYGITAGNLMMSGSKLFIGNGTAWKLVTSA